MLSCLLYHSFQPTTGNSACVGYRDCGVKTMFQGLRGLAQAFVRGAVAAGRKAVETFDTLVESGLGYFDEQFKADWIVYDQQKSFIELAGGLDKDQLIPGPLHGESPQNLTAKFKYDLKTVYEDLKGKTTEVFWSVINNERLTQTEIMDYAAIFAKDSEPGDYPMHGQPEIVGIWTRGHAGIA